MPLTPFFTPSPKELPSLGPLCLFSIPHSISSATPKKLQRCWINSCSGIQAHTHGLRRKRWLHRLPQNRSVMPFTRQTMARQAWECRTFVSLSDLAPGRLLEFHSGQVLGVLSSQVVPKISLRMAIPQNGTPNHPVSQQGWLTQWFPNDTLLLAGPSEGRSNAEDKFDIL